jgi:GNAT superfamily N-acetyltransferase
MPTYHVRPATLDDADALVRHRLGMFADMGLLSTEADAIDRAFRQWLAEMLPAGTYRGWVVEAEVQRPADASAEAPRAKAEAGRHGPEIVAGGGITILPWPPGQLSMTGRIAFAYNVYVDSSHRSLGVGRMIMDAIHGWCRQNGIDGVGLNASKKGFAPVRVPGVSGHGIAHDVSGVEVVRVSRPGDAADWRKFPVFDRISGPVTSLAVECVRCPEHCYGESENAIHHHRSLH